ncbi:MAG: hypothetical protein JSV98_08630 [candidate division WOR-3 bacterium]|nr:MAG: hypothetical protein JSV98_08630 [candidate division WOR-3 bacterium]
MAIILLFLVSCSEMETKWTREIDALGPGNYIVNSISSLKNETYVIGTYWQGQEDSRCFTAMYHNDGSLDWFNVFESPGVKKAEGIEIVASTSSAEQVDAGKEVYVLVKTTNANGHQSVVLAGYDTLRNVDWQNTVISSEGTLDAALLSDHVGNLYVVGWEKDSDNRSNIYVGKYNESGDVAWFTKYYNDELDFTDLQYDMIRSNYLLMTGVLETSGELFYIRYDASGQFMGYSIHEGLSVNELSSAKIDPEGNVYITASIDDPEHGEDYVTIVYDRHNNLRWTSQYDGAAHRNDRPKAIAIDESFNVYVGGISENEEGIPVITVVKYDSTGSSVWMKNLPQKDAAELILMEPRYIPMGRYDEERYLYIGGITGDKAFIARCNLDGVFSWSNQYGQSGTITEPTAISGHVLAFQSIEDGQSHARIMKFGPSMIIGLARWD